MVEKLYEAYEDNRVRIKLNLKEYSPKNDKIIELVRARMFLAGFLRCLNQIGAIRID